MPRTKRQTVHYTRGEFQLIQRQGRPNLEISWWDRTTQRQRYASTATIEVEAAKLKLDDKYLEITKGRECCPTCRRPYDVDKQLTALEAIEVYLATSKDKPSYKAIESRIAHILNYLETQHNSDPYCAEVDESWIAGFRKWVEQIPVVSPAGNIRDRALSTIENSVIALAAAIRCVGEKPSFTPIQTKMLNRTPSFRASIDDLARMFGYALKLKRRANLLAFLRHSVVTMGRPDAVHDISNDPKRKQWDAQHHVLNLNPIGRRQTKKYRSTVPIARQAVWLYERLPLGLRVPGNAKKAMTAMAKELGLPGDGESGLKLIRRSMASLVRHRLEEEEKPMDQLEVFLGHRVIGSISELYAPFSTRYLRTVKVHVEAIIDEIEALVPGAFLDTNSTRVGDRIERRLP